MNWPTGTDNLQAAGGQVSRVYNIYEHEIIIYAYNIIWYVYIIIIYIPSVYGIRLWGLITTTPLGVEYVFYFQYTLQSAAASVPLIYIYYMHIIKYRCIFIALRHNITSRNNYCNNESKWLHYYNCEYCTLFVSTRY